jgi:hypothetical protein
MSELVIRLPEYLKRQAEAFAAHEGIPLDELMALALASHLTGWQAKDYMEERAKRGTWEKFKAVLESASDVPPPEWDRPPDGQELKK